MATSALLGFVAPALPKTGHRRVATAASSRGGSSVVPPGCDLYELLGVQNDASQSEIKRAYRWLQKRCHPDVAGSLGHDMSIVLNDAYALLSDSARRSSYDKVREERMDFDGFAGVPMYSTWLGLEEEQRAVFVDESRCVGCLKCALIASKTFAIEKRFGRARAIGQWGDPEHVIEDAIRSCPVDCISWVDRSQIPALEYVMSKQARKPVTVYAENNAGKRDIDVFKAAEKFLKRKSELDDERTKQNRAPTTGPVAPGFQSQAGWWWSAFFSGVSYHQVAEDAQAALRGAIVRVPRHEASFVDSRFRALYEAAVQHRLGLPERPIHHRQVHADEYWVPCDPVESTVDCSQQAQGGPKHSLVDTSESKVTPMGTGTGSPTRLQALESEVYAVVPALFSVVASAVVIGLGSGSRINMSSSSDVSGPLSRLSGGLMIDELNASVAMHAFLASVAWYLLGLGFSRAIMALVIAVQPEDKT